MDKIWLRAALAFSIACLNCFAKFHLSSIVSPKYLADFFQFISVFPIFSLLANFDDLFENNMAVLFDA